MGDVAAMEFRQTLRIVWLPVLLSCAALAALVVWTQGGGRWLGEELLDPEQRAWLEAHRGRVVLGYDPRAHPVEFRNEAGEFDGMAADHLHLLERKIGFEFRVAEFDSWEEAVEMARAGKIDLLPAVARTPEREDFLLFTDAYLSSPTVILVRDDGPDALTLGDLHGRSVSVARGWAIESYLRREHPQIDLRPDPDLTQGLVDLSLGRVDAAISVLAIAAALIEREALTNLRMAGDAGRTVELRIGSRADEPVLHEILERGLASISRAERLEITRRWVPLTDAPGAGWQVWLGTGAGGALLLLALGSVLAWNRALNRIVQQRTGDLERELAGRESAEAALSDSEQSLAVSLEAIGDAIIATDSKGCIVRMNRAACELVGATLEQSFGRPARSVFALLDRVTREPVAGALETVLASPDTVGVSADALIVAHDGCEVRISETCAPLLSRAGQVVGTVLALRDVTEEHELRDRRLDSRRLEAVGQLAGGLAHDFNNLLAAIMGNAELIQLDGDADSANREALDEIVKASQRAANLTRQLLAFSRAGHVEQRDIEVHALIESLVDELGRERDARVRLECELDAEGSNVRGDPQQVENVLRDLCANALDAMPVGGTLSIGTRNVVPNRERLLSHPGLAPVPHLEIRIRDTGVGMSPDVLARVFEPFFSTKRARGAATGLGLAGAYGSIRSHGGAIEVESRPGSGATFTVLLPLAERPDDQAPPVVAGEGRVLVVDDDDGVRLLASKVLGGLGYDVATCGDGLTAVDLFKKHHREIGLVLLDLTMPRLSGENVFDRMQEIDASVPVIIASGYVESPTARGMLERGARGVLWKPFHIDDLARTVQEHVVPSKDREPS
ncbi:MAG: transporter substrate-binding domain-containing protein [Deltaproteobacteria bacterium]|nr:transporter substrate-binding domain-containing protein [Deltaproteobacteria bacterium]